MIIENPDAFKSWLTSILEPLCDADPAALAKYVYALVKKDKPLEELRDGMLDQLDVFLQQETKQFVDMLFKSLESNDYLKAIEKQASPLPEGTEPEKADAENHPPNGTLEENVVATGGVPRARSPPPAPPAPAHRHRLVVSRARPPHPLLVHRAPPMEHTLVKVLPLTELLEEPVDQPPTRRDRRGETLRDTDERRRRRSRSWERRARPRRHAERRDHDDRRDDRSRRPVSRSPSPRGRYRHRSPPPPAMDRPPSRSRSRSPVPVRDRDHERERDRLRVPREMERDRMSRDREHRDRVSRSRDRDRSRERSRDRSRGSGSPVKEPRLDHSDAYKRRCRDYDEKGYCMRGDLCQWDHGSDPVVLEDAALSRVLAVPPPVPEYNPLTPDIWSASAGFPPYLHPHQHHPPRELIPIPSRVRHVAPPPPHAPPPRHPPPNKKNFDYNRTGGPRPPLPAHAANCSLEVKKVPRGLNDITHLNNHFCKFGKIVNIQVCYDGDPEAAMITFSNPTEANIAYKSTEAVLNNRFIKVFWHNPENKQENNIQKANQQTDRQTPQHPMSHNKVLINRENIKATADNKQQAEKLQQQQQQQTKLTETANGQEPKKEAPKPMEKFKKVTEMYKRAQALLDKQLQQQRLLIDKLESGNITTQQKPALMEAINSTHEGIEKLHKEIGAYSKILTQLQTKKPKTREEAQKEILDAELDLFTKQQEGQDVTELMKKIAELRRQMAIQFPSVSTARRTYSRGGRFNTSTRFSRNNAAAPKPFSMNQTVDHRPRALLISGFEADELDALVTHFSQFGAITHKESNLSVPELVVVYSARAHAEHAAVAGKHYNDRTLSVTWVASPKLTTTTNNNEIRQPNTNGDATTNNAKEPEPPQEISEDALLRFDEEDDEDAEDRSWRR